MSFNFKFSISVSLDLGTPEEENIDHRTAAIEDEEFPSPGSTNAVKIWVMHQARSPSSIRPPMPRFARCIRNQEVSPTYHAKIFDDDPIRETVAARAQDRKSLDILLHFTNHPDASRESNQTRYTAFQSNIPTMTMTSFGDPFASYRLALLQDDSGSDLVSSLQRTREGGLASYFEELDVKARSRSLQRTGDSSPTESFEHVDHQVDENIDKDIGEAAIECSQQHAQAGSPAPSFEADEKMAGQISEIVHKTADKQARGRSLQHTDAVSPASSFEDVSEEVYKVADVDADVDADEDVDVDVVEHEREQAGEDVPEEAEGHSLQRTDVASPTSPPFEKPGEEADDKVDKSDQRTSEQVGSQTEAHALQVVLETSSASSSKRVAAKPGLESPASPSLIDGGNKVGATLIETALLSDEAEHEDWEEMTLDDVSD